MKRNLLLYTCVFAFVMIVGSAHTVSPSNAEQAAPAMIYYTWYYDWDHTDPVGSVATLAEELNRLRTIWPEYIFSAFPGGGLTAFEHGDHGSFNDCIIFSNIVWQ